MSYLTPVSVSASYRATAFGFAYYRKAGDKFGPSIFSIPY